MYTRKGYKQKFVAFHLQEQQRDCETVQHSTSWFQRSAFPNTLLKKSLETIQILPMETAFVLLEKSFIQLDPYYSYFGGILSFWYFVLEPRKENVSIYLSPFFFKNQFSSSKAHWKRWMSNVLTLIISLIFIATFFKNQHKAYN